MKLEKALKGIYAGAQAITILFNQLKPVRLKWEGKINERSYKNRRNRIICKKNRG